VWTLEGEELGAESPSMDGAHPRNRDRHRELSPDCERLRVFAATELDAEQRFLLGMVVLVGVWYLRQAAQLLGFMLFRSGTRPQTMKRILLMWYLASDTNHLTDRAGGLAVVETA